MNILFDEIIFGKNDIRGKVDVEFPPELALIVGMAYAEYIVQNGADLDETWISVGMDVRKHSPVILNNLIEGLVKSGVNVYDMGLCPTPLGYFSEYAVPNVKGTLVVTASHNPPEYNGIKLTFDKSILGEKEISELKEIVKKGNFNNTVKKGQVKKYDIISDYVNFLGDEFKGKGKNIKFVVDSGNATGGIVAPQIYRLMESEVVEIFSEPDGDFPNHHPNPSSEKNLEHLKKKVIETNSDFGIAFDGDSDRIGLVDDKGNMIPGDRLMLVFAMDILKKNKSLEKVSFVSEVKCSQVLYDEIERCGGRAVMWKTGHGFIKNKMKEENALMGGEMSGHIFFKDRYYGFDDAIYAGCRFIEIISQLRSESAKSSVSEFLNSFPKSITSKEIRFSCPNEHKYRIVKELQEEFSVLPNIFCNVIQQIIKIDGVRIVFADGFALIRASNTEPVFTMRFEASTKKNLDNYKQVMLSIVDKKVSECCKV